MPDRTVCTDDKGCASATVCVVTLRAAQPCGTLATPWLAAVSGLPKAATPSLKDSGHRRTSSMDERVHASRRG